MRRATDGAGRQKAGSGRRATWFWDFVERAADVALRGEGLPRLTDRPYIYFKGRDMTLLSKSQIFEADDRSFEDVDCPEWGGTVRVRGLTGTERDAYEASMQKQIGGKEVRDLRNFRARLVALAAINEDGTPLFQQNEVAALAGRSSAALSRLFDVVCRLSGITDEDKADLEGNSDGGQSEPPTSASPSPTVPESMSSSPAPAPGASPSTWPTNGSTGHSVPNASITSPR